MLLRKVANHTRVAVKHRTDRNHAQVHDLLLQLHGEAVGLAQRLQNLVAAAALILDQLPHASLDNSNFAREVEHAVELLHVDAQRARSARARMAPDGVACTCSLAGGASADRPRYRFSARPVISRKRIYQLR